MSQRPFRLGRRHRWVVYCIFGLLFASGFVGWLADEATEGAREPIAWAEAWKPRLMRVHTAAAMGFLVVLGTVLATHVQRAWPSRINRNSGLLLGGWLLTQILTAYALLSFGTKLLGDWIGQTHVTLGLLAPIVLGGHILWGKRRMRRPTPPPDTIPS